MMNFLFIRKFNILFLFKYLILIIITFNSNVYSSIISSEVFGELNIDEQKNLAKYLGNKIDYEELYLKFGYKHESKNLIQSVDKIITENNYYIQKNTTTYIPIRDVILKEYLTNFQYFDFIDLRYNTKNCKVDIAISNKSPIFLKSQINPSFRTIDQLGTNNNISKKLIDYRIKRFFNIPNSEWSYIQDDNENLVIQRTFNENLDKINSLGIDINKDINIKKISARVKSLVNSDVYNTIFDYQDLQISDNGNSKTVIFNLLSKINSLLSQDFITAENFKLIEIIIFIDTSKRKDLNLNSLLLKVYSIYYNDIYSNNMYFLNIFSKNLMNNNFTYSLREVPGGWPLLLTNGVFVISNDSKEFNCSVKNFNANLLRKFRGIIPSYYSIVSDWDDFWLNREKLNEINYKNQVYFPNIKKYELIGAADLEEKKFKLFSYNNSFDLDMNSRLILREHVFNSNNIYNVKIYIEGKEYSIESKANHIIFLNKLKGRVEKITISSKNEIIADSFIIYNLSLKKNNDILNSKLHFFDYSKINPNNLSTTKKILEIKNLNNTNIIKIKLNKKFNISKLKIFAMENSSYKDFTKELYYKDSTIYLLIKSRFSNLKLIFDDDNYINLNDFIIEESKILNLSIFDYILFKTLNSKNESLLKYIKINNEKGKNFLPVVEKFDFKDFKSQYINLEYLFYKLK